MIVGKTKRPRNVDAPRAAAILYGDWGTSKAYVIGLAFAIAGHSSFWLIAAMCVLCAVRGIGRTLDFGIHYAQETNRPLYILFVRELPVLTAEDRKRKWADDREAHDIFVYAKEKAEGHTLLPCYAVSDAAAETIVDIAATVGASQLVLGAPERNMIVNLLRGNIIRNISSMLPDEIDLLVYA